MECKSKVNSSFQNTREKCFSTAITLGLPERFRDKGKVDLIRLLISSNGK